MSVARFKTFGELFTHIASLKKVAERVACLQANDSLTLRFFLQFIFGPPTWLVPEGTPPHKSDLGALGFSPSHLFRECRLLYLFVEGVQTNLSQARREQMFIQMLERLHPSEVKLLIAVKDKTFVEDYKCPKTTVKAACPNLFDAPYPPQLR